MVTENPQSPKQKLRSGYYLYPSQMVLLEKTLHNLCESIPAKFILLADSSGQIVAIVGDYSKIDLIALGSLLAGDLAASHEIARITGEYQDFQLILREGERAHLAISEAGPLFVLLVLFDKEVPLGWARRSILIGAQEIYEISKANPTEKEKDLLHDEIDADGLPDLFTDALGDIWKGT